MKDITEVQDYIRKMISDKIDQGQVVSMSWITNEVLQEHGDMHGSDSDFYVICARHYVSDIVKRQIDKYKPGKNYNKEQLTLEGFEHLQQAYTVPREEEKSVLVPVDQLTDEEIELRAQEYEAMAQGNLKHAQELREYIRLRSQDPTA